MIPPLIGSDCFFSIIFIYSINAKSTSKSKKIYSNADSMKVQILNENKGLSGIYQWVNNVNGMSYTGQAIDIQKRLQEHYKSYELNQLVEKVNKFYSNIHLQRAIKKYGLNNFSIHILEFIPAGEEQNLTIREQYYMDLVSEEMKYNISPTAGSSLGVKHSEKTRDKMSTAKSGENHPLFGKSHSSETRKKMSAAQSGENSQMFGKTHSLETSQKMSATKSGENHHLFGKTPSENTR